MSNLDKKHCIPCEGGMPALTAAQISELLPQLTSWQVSENQQEIFRDYAFKNYYQTMAFVNAVAWLAHQEDHHPDLEVGYNHCKVRYSTHAIGGLSENDFICAAKVNHLLPK